jgi:hypothetical protein
MESEMHINDIESLAMRLRSLIRRADTFGKTREDVLWEIEDIAKDLQKQADRMDRDMEDMYLNSLADAHEYAMGR